MNDTSDQTNPILETALLGWDNGLNVFPPAQDGTKRPDTSDWSILKDQRLPRVTVAEMYRGPRTGSGIVTGKVFASGSMNESADVGVECFEFDDRETYDAFLVAARNVGLGDLVNRVRDGYEETTPSGGVHWFWYCIDVAGNTKLAQRPVSDGTTKTLIETRGHGGYIVTAPSNGRVHPTGKPYVLNSGGFDTIPTVTPDERTVLFDLARTFDQMPERQEHSGKSSGRTDRPGDDFNRRETWESVIGPHGWEVHSKSGAVTNWRRPGAKTAGKDATTNADGTDRLFVHSTSATPFQTDRYYDKFAAYALLTYDGDFAAASKALRDEGYGTGERDDRAKKRTFTIYTIAEYRKRPIPDYLLDGVIRRGGLAALIGDPASYKTFVALGMALSVSLGIPWADRRTAQGPVLHIVGEGGGAIQKRIDAFLKFAGVSDAPGFFLLPDAPQLPDANDRTALIDAVRALPNMPVLVVIDTLARTFGDGNENAQEDMNRYVRAADEIQKLGPAVLILHHNRKDGGYRGSTAFAGALDTMIETEKTASGVVLKCGKQKDDEPFSSIALEKKTVALGPIVDTATDVIDLDIPTSLVFVPAEQGATTATTGGVFTEAQRKALIALRDSVDGDLATGRWLDATGLRESTFYDARTFLVRNGYVEVIDVARNRKANRITDAGQKALDPRTQRANSEGASHAA